MSINLALADAANNCARENAVATITLKSGRQFTGTLKRGAGVDSDTHVMEVGQGWVTFLKDEVAAVQSRMRHEAVICNDSAEWR